jgi:hypothetical protein
MSVRQPANFMRGLSPQCCAQIGKNFFLERETGLEPATFCLTSRCPRSKTDLATCKRSRGGQIAKVLDVNACETIQVVETSKEFRHLNHFQRHAVSDMIPASQARCPTF